jgi:hypothetical protein
MGKPPMVRDGVRQGQIGRPEKRDAAQFDGVAQHGIKAEEDRNGNEHGQTTAQRADLVLLEQLGGLLVFLERIVLVFVGDGLELRRDGLLPLLRAGAGRRHRPEDQFDDDRDGDDRTGRRSTRRSCRPFIERSRNLEQNPKPRKPVKPMT